MKTTLIRVSLETKEELSKLGKYGDSMDSIIKRLIDRYKKDAKK